VDFHGTHEAAGKTALASRERFQPEHLIGDSVMRSRQKTWALVLAAGDGTRLASLTTDATGNSVPKQFCSLNGGGSLLQDALARARRLAPRERQCAIVSAGHQRFWQQSLWSLPRSNTIVQPRNCGTANGILLAVLSILERDPLARIVFLPSDHYVRNEAVLAASLREAVAQLSRRPDGLVLIGIEPDEADPELGYIVPGRTEFDGARSVRQFVEKPPAPTARDLIASGAVWNSFIFAAHGPALLGMIREHMPSIVEDMATALALDARRGGEPVALEQLYDDLPSVDFSRAIMQRASDRLSVVTAPACGWSDLGTPIRVAQALQRLTPRRRPRLTTMPVEHGFINLAMQHAQHSIAV
jgi:mannose-1-phosphate guanylyltransferase